MKTFVIQAEADTLNESGQPDGDRWELEAVSVEAATETVRGELDATPGRQGWRIVYVVPLGEWEGWQDA